jgi:MFS family permease
MAGRTSAGRPPGDARGLPPWPPDPRVAGTRMPGASAPLVNSRIRTGFSSEEAPPGVSTPNGERQVLPRLYLATLGTWAAYALIVVVLPFRFQQLGLSVEEYGVALAVYALGTLATEGLWGYLAFRLGSARSLGGLAIATAAAMLALGFGRSFAELVVLLGVYGMLVVYSTPLIRWIGMNAAGPGTAGQGLGRLGLFFGIGLSAGTAVGPLLYLYGGFWLNLYVATAVFAVSTVPLLFVPWNSVSLPRTRLVAKGSLRALVEQRFVLATVLVVFYFMIYTLITNFLQYYSIGLFHGTVQDTGYVIGAARAVALVSGLLIGALVDRWGTRRAAPVGFLLLLAGAIGTWASVTYPEMTVAALVMSTGAGWLSVTLLPMALTRIRPANQGTAVGVFGSFEDLGLILGPLVLGVVYSTLGPRDLFPVAAVLALTALLLALLAPGSRPAR